MGAFLGLPRPSLPLCFAVPEGRFCGVCLVVVASKMQDQEQQPEQAQKGAKTWPKASVSSFFFAVSEGTLGILRALFWAFPVLLPLCFAVREGRFCGVCLVVGASELQDQEQQLEQKHKGAKK